MSEATCVSPYTGVPDPPIACAESRRISGLPDRLEVANPDSKAQDLPNRVGIRPKILDELAAGCREFDAPIQTRPIALPIVQQTQVTVLLMHPHRQPVFPVEAQDVGHLETERHEGQMILAQFNAVEPDLRARMHSAEVQPDTTPFPLRRSVEMPAIPARARVSCPKGPYRPAVLEQLVLAVAPKALPLPAARHSNLVSQSAPVVEPLLLDALILGIKAKAPLAGQADPSLPRVEQHRIHPHGRERASRHRFSLPRADVLLSGHEETAYTNAPSESQPHYSPRHMMVSFSKDWPICELRNGQDSAIRRKSFNIG